MSPRAPKRRGDRGRGEEARLDRPQRASFSLCVIPGFLQKLANHRQPDPPAQSSQQAFKQKQTNNRQANPLEGTAAPSYGRKTRPSAARALVRKKGVSNGVHKIAFDFAALGSVFSKLRLIFSGHGRKIKLTRKGEL